MNNLLNLHIFSPYLCLIILKALPEIRCEDDDIIPSEYPKCVAGIHGKAFEDGERRSHKMYNNNTWTSCIIRCKSQKYKFAGTMDKMCLCADNIRGDTESGTCDIACPGDENEFCGGEEGISLDKTGFQIQETTEKEITTSATTKYTTRSSTYTQFTTLFSSVTSQTTTVKLIDVTTESALGNKSKTFPTKKKNGLDTLKSRVVYIAIPVVIVMCGIIALIVYLVVRRQRVKKITKVSYHADESDQSRHNSATDKNFGTKTLLESNVGDAEYSSVFPTNSPQVVNTYGCLKSQTGFDLALSSEYSHLTVKNTCSNLQFTDNTYSHIGNTKMSNKESEKDNTYNTLQTSQQKHAKGAHNKTEDNQDTLYDHAKFGGRNKNGNSADKYTHLNSMKMEKVMACPSKFSSINENKECDSLENKETGMYEEACHHYFILEPQKIK